MKLSELQPGQLLLYLGEAMYLVEELTENAVRFRYVADFFKSTKLLDTKSFWCNLESFDDASGVDTIIKDLRPLSKAEQVIYT